MGDSLSWPSYTWNDIRNCVGFAASCARLVQRLYAGDHADTVEAAIAIAERHANGEDVSAASAESAAWSARSAAESAAWSTINNLRAQWIVRDQLGKRASLKRRHAGLALLLGGGLPEEVGTV